MATLEKATEDAKLLGEYVVKVSYWYGDVKYYATDTIEKEYWIAPGSDGTVEVVASYK